MLSTDFIKLLAPFKQLSNKNALSITYRSLELADNAIRGAARQGMLEVFGEWGFPEGPPIYVDATAFIAIIGSLPSNQEVEFNLEDGGVLSWSCAAAKGRLALLKIPEMPRISHASMFDDAPGYEPGWRPTGEFVEALRLGMLSCGNESLATIGAYGVVLDTSGDLAIYSSDNTTVSAAFMPEGDKLEGPPILTFSPEALNVLAAVIDPQDEFANLFLEEGGIFYEDSNRRCLIKQIAPLKVDINSIFEAYQASDIMIELPTERIQAFIKRVAAISDNKTTSILLGASKGRLNLSFSDGLASSEEYHLVDELEVPDLPPIELDAVKLGRALAHCSHIMLDHIDRRVVILQGNDPLFQYIISGKS